MKLLLHASRALPGRRCFVEAELLYEPRDLWIGAYWKRHPRALEVYLCFLPVLPIRLYWQWGV